jgi:hypothetical protein
MLARYRPRIEGMGWRWRLGLSMLTLIGGALMGWALSLTQGPHARHWPWVAVGGLAALAVGLIAVEVIARRHHGMKTNPGSEPPVQPGGVIIYARQMRNNGAILASGPGSFIDVTSEDFANSGIVHADQGDAEDII